MLGRRADLALRARWDQVTANCRDWRRHERNHDDDDDDGGGREYGHRQGRGRLGTDARGEARRSESACLADDSASIGEL
jgi:hypothetical protein